jgi:hypothetical protein
VHEKRKSQPEPQERKRVMLGPLAYAPTLRVVYTS